MIKVDYIGDKNFVFDKNINPILRKCIKCVILIWDMYWISFLTIARVKRKKRNTPYKFSICAIFKNETTGLKEWIEYHSLIGVDHFYLYNNFSDDNYLEVLKPYIDNGIVTLVEWPVLAPAQMAAYQHFYNTYRNETQWAAFIDLDEFICMKERDDIKDWSCKYDNYPSVVVYWKQFGSNNQIKHDHNKLIIEQYVICWNRPYDYGKSFFNLDFEVYEFTNNRIHELCACARLFGKKFLIPPINEFKFFIHFRCNRIGIFRTKENFSIQINHYGSKSYEDFFIAKRKRGDAAYSGEVAKHTRSSYAYLYNQRHCVTTDYTIHRFMLELKLRMDNTIENFL